MSQGVERRKCQYCGTELRLWQNLQKREFCSAEHQEKYFTELQAEMIARVVAARSVSPEGGVKDAGEAVRKESAPEHALQPASF